jgi:hypothetical protein
MSIITSGKKYRKGKVDILLKGGGTNYTNIEVQCNQEPGNPTGDLYIGYGPGAPNVNLQDAIVIINTADDHISGLIAIGTLDTNNQHEIVVTQLMQNELFNKLSILSDPTGNNRWSGSLSNYFKVSTLD